MHLKQNRQEILDVNNKLYKKLLWGIGVVIVAVILTLFIVSRTYIQNLVYHERLNQMEEVTHQMFRSLEDVIDTHWDEVDVQCNYLYCAKDRSRVLPLSEKAVGAFQLP